MDPTPEQQQAADLFATGDTLVIEAGAGTGKTSTLGLLARGTPKTGTYVAFNKSIALEAGRRMPMTVNASTMHGLAMRRVGAQLRHRLDSKREPAWKVADRIGIDRRGLGITVGGRTKILQAGYLAGHVMRAVALFCASADDEPGVQHFPYIDGIDTPKDDGRRTFGNNRELSRLMVRHLRDAWADLTEPNGDLRFTHDVYLKLWQLGRHSIPGDYILVDEAQDLSPVMLAAVTQQDAQLVFVGDSQQQIYEWRGAVNALASVPDANRTFLTQSFRFGPAIAEVANTILEQLDAELRLTGTPNIDSTVGRIGRPKAILCRTNAAAVNAVLSLQRIGLAPFLVGGGEEVVRFARAAADLQAGRPTHHPELACFDSWGDVQAYVANDPQGDELRMLVNMLDEYGVQIILDALAGLVGEDHADVIVSTAHKAKGREWPTVRLAPDFQTPADGDGGAGELRLLYVSCTRARDALDPTMCEPVAKMLAVPA